MEEKKKVQPPIPVIKPFPRQQPNYLLHKLLDDCIDSKYSLESRLSEARQVLNDKKYKCFARLQRPPIFCWAIYQPEEGNVKVAVKKKSNKNKVLPEAEE